MRVSSAAEGVWWRMRGTCFASYYWMTGRRSLLRLVDRLDEWHISPRGEIDAHRKRSVSQLLAQASLNVPYYRDLIDHQSLSEATIMSDLQRLPVLTKSIIRNEAMRLVSERLCEKTQWNTSGGSTGKPIKLLQDSNMQTFNRAAELLFMRWAGHRMGEPHVFVWGVPKATFHEKMSFHERLFRVAHNQTYLNCYQMTDETLRIWVRCINDRRPVLIEAYADAIYQLSSWIADNRIQVHQPRAIITSAGVLTPEMRTVVGGCFGCPILNRYGSREVGDIACSCLSGHELHVNECACYIEIVDEEGRACAEGVEGDILVTLLTNYAMPLIRYKIEDRGAWAPGYCGCGRTTRRLAAVSGRQSDYLLALDGSKINGTALTTLLYPVPHIVRYQYRQVEKGKVTLAVVPKQGVGVHVLEQEIQPSLEKLKRLLNGGIVELTVVSEIPPSRSGKYRYILNDLART